jgi:hypothetical protein
MKVFVFSPSGSDEKADQEAALELERITREQEYRVASKPAVQAEPRLFTVYLLPSDYSPQTRQEALLPLDFPFELADNLDEKMSEDLRDIYALEGESRSDFLGTSISLSYEIYSNRLGAPLYRSGLPDFRYFQNTTLFKDRDDLTQAGRAVLDAFRVANAALKKDIQKCREIIEEKAKAVALERLQNARSEILTETMRYLRFPQQPQIAAKDLLELDIKPSAVVLEGPGVAPLVGGLRQIQERGRALKSASELFEQERSRASDQFWLEGLTTFQNVLGDLSDEDMERKFPGSHSAVDEATSDLALSLSVQCRDYPILHRVWGSPDLSGDVQAIPSPRGEGTLIAQTASAGRAINELKENIWNSLRGAWRSNNDLEDELLSSGSHVWRYPPIIQETLETLGFDDPSLEFQAAQERMSEEEDMSVAGVLGAITGAIEMGAPLLAGPAAPEVMAALAIAGLALGTIDLIQDFLGLQSQSNAFKAVLDPSRALASEPGYTGFIVGVAFTLLGVKDVRNALRSARYAGELAAAEKALEAFKP